MTSFATGKDAAAGDIALWAAGGRLSPSLSGCKPLKTWVIHNLDSLMFGTAVANT
jgi:hypothetical protein